MKFKLMALPLLAFTILVGSCNSTPYEKAFDLYETSFKKNGDAFYKMPELKEIMTLLEAIPVDSPDYGKSRELMTKIQNDRREFRTRNVNELLEKARARFKEEDARKQKQDPLGSPPPQVPVQKDPLLPQKK